MSLAVTYAHRHRSTVDLLEFFDFGHLPAHLQQVSAILADAAQELVEHLGDGPELSVGLRKLLEGKDAFVRQAVRDARTREIRELRAALPVIAPAPRPEAAPSAPTCTGGCPTCDARAARA